ncbi:MAG: hypothetical protein ACFFCS_16400 [Candidatus Hodarchaeota archaeon]
MYYGVSPPKKATVIVSGIIVLIGLIWCGISMLGWLNGLFSTTLIPGVDARGHALLTGMIIEAIGVGLLFLGTRVRGL